MTPASPSPASPSPASPTQAPRRTTHRSTDRRAEIAAAALACLQRDGYAALTARKIAAEAGLSLGHITYHFASMDEVMAEAYRLASARLHEAETEGMAGKAAPLDRLAAFLRAGFTPQMLAAPRLRMRIDLWSAALSHPAIARTEAELYATYRSTLEALLSKLGPGDVTPVADLIMAALDGLWLDHLRRRDLQAVENVLTLCLGLAETRLSLPAPKP